MNVAQAPPDKNLLRFAGFGTPIDRCAMVWGKQGLAGVSRPEAEPATTRRRGAQRFAPAHETWAISALRITMGRLEGLCWTAPAVTWPTCRQPWPACRPITAASTTSHTASRLLPGSAAAGPRRASARRMRPVRWSRRWARVGCRRSCPATVSSRQTVRSAVSRPTAARGRDGDDCRSRALRWAARRACSTKPPPDRAHPSVDGRPAFRPHAPAPAPTGRR